MLSEYIKAALKKAKYEILEDDGTFYGEIPDFQGVYANAETLEECRSELAEILEAWIFFRISRNLELPIVDDLKLQIERVV
jgi:predicted RNase H-like HicB family nuclease